MAQREVPKPVGPRFVYFTTVRIEKLASILDIFKKKQRVAGEDQSPVSKDDLVPGRPIIGAASGKLTVSPDMTIMDMVSRRMGQKHDPIAMIELFRDYNPDASLAVWNFLRLVHPEHSIVAKLLPDQVEVDTDGLAMLRYRSDNLRGVYGRDYGGGLGQLIDVLTLTLISQGAIAGELEMSEDLTDVLDWCPVDPREITFFGTEDTGHVVPGIEKHNKFYPLPREQFRYIPLDPAISSPYGRGLFWSSLEAVFFQAEVLRDLKVVAHTAGHPRLHIKVLEEVVDQYMPARYRMPGQEDAARVWRDGVLSSLASEYSQIKADDAFITWDWVEPSGLDAGRPSFDLKSLIGVVETQVISSLKQLPILMGRIDGSGLAHGSVQWQIFALGVQALRTRVATLASWWATQTLRIWGRQSIGLVEFPTLRTQDRLREAQAQALEVQTAIMMYKMGWASNDELAEEHVGHAAIGEPMIETAIDSESTAIDDESQEEGIGEGEEGSADEEQDEEARLLANLLKDFEWQADVPGSRDFGLNGNGSEAAYFALLPKYMRARIASLQTALDVFSAVRRDRVFDELDQD